MAIYKQHTTCDINAIFCKLERVITWILHHKRMDKIPTSDIAKDNFGYNSTMISSLC